MNKPKYILLLLVTLLILGLYQQAPAQVYGNSSLHSLVGNLTARRGSSALSIFSRFSTGSDIFRQSLDRPPDPLAARSNVNRRNQMTYTGVAKGLSPRISAYGAITRLNSYTSNSTLSGFYGDGNFTRPGSLTSAVSGVNVRAYSSNLTSNYPRAGRFFGGSFLSRRPSAHYPSILTTNLQQSTLKPSLFNQKGLFNLDNRGSLSFQNDTLANRTARSDLETTRLSMQNSLLGVTQSSPFLRVKKY